MDTKTGNIYTPEMMEAFKAHQINSEAKVAQNLVEQTKNMIPMQIPPTQKQMDQMRVGPYDPCPCNSGKKFKFCCFKTKTQIHAEILKNVTAELNQKKKEEMEKRVADLTNKSKDISNNSPIIEVTPIEEKTKP